MVKIKKDTTLQEDAQAIIEQFAKDNPERVEKYGMPKFVPGTTNPEPWGQSLEELLQENRKLKELFEYTYEIKDVTGEIRTTLQQFPQEYLGLLIRILELYKKELIENSFRAYPMNVDALNCRNGSVTVLGDLIRLISGFRHKTQDMEYRDDGTLREDLRKANEKLKEDPLQNIRIEADGKKYKKDTLGNYSIPLSN